jgi:sugar O-acyltransferase (sialic acid O-acetyltransferase NeuD family)
MANPSLIIVGSGGHAVSVFDVARSAGFDVRCFVDRERAGDRLLGVLVVRDVTEGAAVGADFCIALGDNEGRAATHAELARTHPMARFPRVIHASAVVSALSSVGEGTVVMPGAVIGPNTKVGRFCILNTRASIDHDCVMDDYASLAPGVTTGGKVRIGSRTAISIGAVIKHNVTVGDDCVIGASSYLNADLVSNHVAFGIPARVVRTRQRGEPYL